MRRESLGIQAKSATCIALVALIVVSVFGTPLLLSAAALLWAIRVF